MPATTQETISLSSTNVIIHPLVLLSVTDHASRSASGSRKRVVGILLGQDNGKTINAANSFAVPFEEDERDAKTWFLDHDYITGMMEMFKKVNAREKMVGWYHTGPRLRSSDLEINELMKRFIPRPVMVIVNPRQRDVGIPTDAYFAVEEIKDDGTATQKTFMHVPSTIEAEEAEEIGVEHLLRDIRDTTAVGTLSTRVSSQLSSLRGLQSRLLEIRDYLQAVVEGKLPVNHQIIYDLQDIFNLLPDLDKNSEAAKSFAVDNNDRLLVVYLSSLIRAVIALHGLISNRRENEKGEEEASNTITNGTSAKEGADDAKKEDGKEEKKKD
ncbi:hypothetical protein NDA11_001866 [Ustilago hordei]|uniref:Probable RPN8-26S proteasome regulatory subunit n=1 Tax=Ustilago hordei TaxID=120017 RepID=I2G6A6_USTHO|nr:putative RPN8 - 26S proteasome regulatory subunit [Ustilago hordei]KAJ1039146.1 hypothetical protein NDA10_005249 [Ustilago hordei]KAJ1586412.1 hypothetical protein NDA12_007699 [Ustilago hordei]KAJ1589270.1 hypothetical protein NDA15_003997 [Ustilago hordei]KAJ1590706.1 hypothetical protein NDA11_001866 [Ustilago hordei]KAJ1601026.1 hypothetical protein NDA14_006192 [Ustilago hordei]